MQRRRLREVKGLSQCHTTRKLQDWCWAWIVRLSGCTSHHPHRLRALQQTSHPSAGGTRRGGRERLLRAVKLYLGCPGPRGGDCPASRQYWPHTCLLFALSARVLDKPGWAGRVSLEIKQDFCALTIYVNSDRQMDTQTLTHSSSLTQRVLSVQLVHLTRKQGK